jgi:hypothetical protein
LVSRHTEFTGQNKEPEDDVKHRRELYSSVKKARVKSRAKTANKDNPFSIFRAQNCRHNINTVTKLKMVSLYDFMLDLFKHNGHCVVMDSAYMSGAMCQVGREEWKINMVGTCQTEICGASPLGKVAYTGNDKEISINSHESLLFSFNTRPKH